MQSPPLVLVAEDEAPLRELLIDYMESAGYRVHGAKDGLDALEAIRNNKYDAIISDGDMPCMSGSDLYRQTCAEFPDLRDRFVFVTGNPHLLPSDLRCPVLPKPFAGKDLLRMVGEAIQGRELRHARAGE